jgi:hypothetical protein
MSSQIKPMALYRFQKSATSKSKYFLREKIGESPLLFGMGKKGADLNKKYVLLDPSQSQKAGGRQYEYALYTSHAEPVSKKRLQDGNDKAAKARITGVNFQAEGRGKAYGDTCSPYIEGDHALLIELSADLQTLKIAVFRDMAAQVKSLFEAWTAGELSLTVERAALPEGGAALPEGDRA